MSLSAVPCEGGDLALDQKAGSHERPARIVIGVSLPPAIPFSVLDRLSLWFRRVSTTLLDAGVTEVRGETLDLARLDEQMLAAGSDAAVITNALEDPYARALLGLARREISRVAALLETGSDRLRVELLASAVVISSLGEHGLETYDRPRFVQRLAWPANRRRASGWSDPRIAERYLDRLRAGAISRFRIGARTPLLIPVASLGSHDMRLADPLT